MLYQPFIPQERANAAYCFDRLRLHAKLGRFWRRLLGCWRPLSSIQQPWKPANADRRYLGQVQSIPLALIGGSVGRCGDFDPAFRPLQRHNRERWINIALAMQTATPLPAVDLVRLNDTYYVLDGHHRVSVARAFGQVTIDANVVAWQRAN